MELETTVTPMAEHWNFGNSSVSHVTLDDLKMDSNMAWLLFSLTSSIAWMVYITFYNSRVVGYFLTKLINRLYFRGAFFRIGSFTINPLAGKIMFRDVVYINFDYTVRIQDGYMIFRWWRTYVPRDVSEDLSHSDTRLSVMLNGLELHSYNRSDVYAQMEKVFGLKPTMLIPGEGLNSEDEAKMREHMMNEENQRQSSAKQNRKRPEAMTATTWRDLIPVIKVDVTSGRFVFGNSIIPTTLSLCVEEAHCEYSTKPAVSKLDHFMHFVKAKVENAKVILASSPKYTGLVDEPPRFMGEGFVVMMSNLLDLYFYMDEPGIVPDEPALFTLANGDIVEAAAPVWGIDIKCGKGTDFSYGPWADRQRDHLFKFFFPSDYQTQVVTPTPKPGDMRQFQTFDVSLSTQDKSTIDILFSKNKETSAVHIITGPGSYLEVTLPWVTQSDGFTTKVTGQLLHVEATTSLQFRSLAECETLQYNIKVHFPLEWNEHQDWSINLTGSKATAYIVYSHKDFFQDLIEDWCSKQRPDILSFVPYTWRFSILLKEFEIITTSNEYNWIDCSSTNQENHHLAFCGDLFDLSFNLPFDDYLPQTIPLKFWIHGEGLDLSMYIPEVSSSRSILMGIDQNARILTRDGQIRRREDLLSKKWRRVCVRSAGWIDCWTVPIVALAIQYIYHPMPPLGPDPQADITTPEKEEILLSPIRIPNHRKSPVINWREKAAMNSGQKFDPTLLSPDKVTVEIEIGSSILFAYGNILKNFIHLKENIFGEDQTFTDMETSNSGSSASRATGATSNKGHKNGGGDVAKSVSEMSAAALDETPKRFDARYYRPFEVTVLLTIHDIQAHVMKNCNDNDPPCPIVLIERLGFEMMKTYTETQLQVLVSPCFLIAHDTILRAQRDRHLRQGHLLLSALQVRGHAMFSNEGRSLDEDTLEYVWMLEVQLGKVSGKLTLPQLCHVVTGLETLVLLAVDAENELRPPKTIRYCHHGTPTNLCPQTREEARYRCPSSEDIKYRMTRLMIDAVDLYLIENGTALHTWVSPIRLSTCNLHGQQVKSGVTLLISTILVRNFMSTGHHFNGNSHSNTNTTGSGRSAKTHKQQEAIGGGGGGFGVGGAVLGHKDDLNLLFQRDDMSHVKSKRESDYMLHRKESNKERDDNYSGRKTGEGGGGAGGGGHFRRGDRDDIYASMYSSSGRSATAANAKEHEPVETWLEVGSLSLGSIIVEAAAALPIPEHQLHLVQHNFLKLHDDKSKRLWFLWMTSVEHSRCGCVGGCAFFGSNRNGPKFYKPSAQDLHDGVNIARYHIHPSSKEYGFGESLLHEGQLVFHTPPYSIQNVTLQECYEYIGRTNVRSPPRYMADVMVSPGPANKFEHAPKGDPSPSNTLRTPCSERSERKLTHSMKERESPQTMDRRGRRFSYTQSRPIIQDVPYSRLLETPSKSRPSLKDSSSTIDGSNGSASSPYGTTGRRPERDGPMNRSLRISPPQTSASDSRLTTAVEYFQGDEPVKTMMTTMTTTTTMHYPQEAVSVSSSAPQANVLDIESDTMLTSEELMNRELQVQRTVSLTSENPSEAFFSADEDVNASQNSGTVRSEVICMPSAKKRFASDLSIGGGAPGDGDSKLSTHRSDYEINTPEHRSLPKRPQSTTDMHGHDTLKRIHGLATPLRKFNASPKPEFRHFKAKCDPLDSQDSSSNSPSLSSTSFISALSSQEDVTLVDLHMQVNRLIVDAPLLMASYMTHLGQMRCPNWSHCSLPYGSDAFSTPLFQKNEDGGLIYIGSKLIPHFEPCASWKEIRVHNRTDYGPFTSGAGTAPAAASSSLPRSHPWDPSVIIRGGADKKQGDNENEDEFLISSSESISRNSIVVRFKGPADVMVTPLLLESLQRMVESITPTLAVLHPLTIINYLHQECVSKVQSDNILKRDQSLSYWSQVHSNSKRSTTERNLQGPGGSVLTDVYEESISTQFQGLVVLPRINVTMIQTSVIEEAISFAALDNVHDLSCTSLLVLSLDSVAARFHLAKTTKASMHTVYTQPTAQSGHTKKGGIFRGTTRALWANISSQSRPDKIPGEPVLIETSEKQLEELVITLDVGKAHAQLRRLKNEGCAFQENQIIITSIPMHQSKAMFEVSRHPPLADDNPQQHQQEKHFGFGYIMFECGLEGVGVKVVKRSHFEKSENASQNDGNNGGELQRGKKVGDTAVAATPNLSERTASHSGSVAGTAATTTTTKMSLKLPITPKLTLSKENKPSPVLVTVDGAAAKSSPASVVVKEETIIEIESQSETRDGHETAPPPSPQVPPTTGATTTTTTTTVASAVAASNTDNGKTSSAFIELKTVWFNFAAPPHVPITRKIDYSRLDWNLLSTASPAITAWMNPSNRFAIKMVAMLRSMHHRRTAVTACVMADALEVQGVHRCAKSRYTGKLTPLSKTLQEDPSCQLCTIMQKYVQKETVRKIETHLRAPHANVPPLTTLRQGVIVLSRQWKNTLYNPMLFEHQYKNKLQPMHMMAYALPQYDEDYDDNDMDTEPYQHHHHHGIIVESNPLLGSTGRARVAVVASTAETTAAAAGGGIVADEETERTTLLGQSTTVELNPHQHHSQQHHSRSVIKLPPEERGPPSARSKYATAAADSLETSSQSVQSAGQRHSGPARKRGLKLLAGGHNQVAASGQSSSLGRHSTMFPILPGFGPDKTEAQIEYGTLIDGSLPSIYSSSDSVDRTATTFGPMGHPKEDLYAWMAKQQQQQNDSAANRSFGAGGETASGRKATATTTGFMAAGTHFYKTTSIGASKRQAVTTVNSHSAATAAGNMYNPDANRLLDAHLIFEPLLSSLGVMPQQMVNNANATEVSLERLGTNLSLVGSFDTLRIDIVVSEQAPVLSSSTSASTASGTTTTSSIDKKSSRAAKKMGSNGKYINIKMPSETPAFLCERVGVDIEVLKVADGFPDSQKPNMLYISRGQLKKHTNTVINFSLNVRYISQQVNMPLLRLLHQISNMYQNVIQAQIEMKEHPMLDGAGTGATGDKRHAAMPSSHHNKDESSLASEMNDATLVESIHEAEATEALAAPLAQIDQDERYDKFNEFFPIGHSVSRTKMPTLGPLIPLTPSPGSRNRPQSFAQKLRSTSKTVKGKLGYTNLSETVSTPNKTSPVSSSYDLPPMPAIRKNTMESKHSVDFIMAAGPLVNEAFVDYPAGGGGGGLSIGDDVSHFRSDHLATPKCWSTINHLVRLYSQMPDTKTVTRKVSMSPDAAAATTANIYDNFKSSKKTTTASQRADEDELLVHPETPIPPPSSLDVVAAANQERTRLMIFGVAKIHRTRLLATLSGLKLEAEITSLQSSATWRKKSRPMSMECSVTGHVGRAMIVLLEGLPPNQQTVVKVAFGKSQTLYSSMSRRGKDKNSGLLSVGPINIDIPQHPVALHGMMTRSSKQLSSTLQELRVTRTSSRLSKTNEELDSPHHNKEPLGKEQQSQPLGSQQPATQQQQQQQHQPSFTSTSSTKPNAGGGVPSNLLQPLVMQFNVVLQSLSVQAALLPSLQAQYKMDNVSSTGFTGSKAKFIIDLPSHSLSFTTKIQQAEANLPAEALIALPPIHVSAEYVPENAPQDVPIDGVVLRQGGYVAARAEIGEFERCLTTDLLNHLVFVQKVFMKEVNEVVQKVYGGEKPVPLWLMDDVHDIDGAAAPNGSNSLKRILFSLNIRVKRIQLTATTPCSSAVRFETGQLELHLSNRVKNIADKSNTKLFGKAQIDLNISLGQLIKNVIFDEAEPEFQQYAFFNTTIGFRNAFQEELVNDDKELVLITLKRPLIYVQPIAVDKAILVWLNYKNAYDYWAEKRANLNKEVLAATQQVYEKLPFGQFSQHLGAPSLSTLFLQLTVEDMGICVPLNPLPLTTWSQRQEYESKGAVVITLENTIISACSSGSLVSKGKFVGLCLRFADDFETSLDDWKPNMSDSSIMNLCVVSEGTYEVCSRTIASKQTETENAKWFLNVKWQMEGVDIHLDVNIGKQLSALGHTLTMLTGLDEDEEPVTIDSPDSEDGGDQMGSVSKAKKKFLESVPDFVFDTSIDPKKRSFLMEKEMSEQLKIISDLRTLGATQNTIAQEEQRLQELQAVCYKYFRRDMIQKWKRPSTSRNPMLKPTNRSQSFIISSPTRRSIESEHLDSVLQEDEAKDSQDSSPLSGPSRSSSLRLKIPQSHRVTFNESMRQSSLPSGESNAAFVGHSDCWNMRYHDSDMNILDIDGEQVELRKKSPIHQGGGTAATKPQEPNIDFELDIKVFVNSGKCVLHTKELDDKVLSQNTSLKQHKRERSIGTDFGGGGGGSPVPTRRNKEKPRIRLNNILLTELTIFHIPGLDVKLHYDSKTVLTDEMSPRLSTCDSLGAAGGGSSMRRQTAKRASLFACVTLQSIPEETIVSPHILEFLEQTLEPIPSKMLTTPTNPVNIELLQRNYATYASFPVDVVVYFHMQPSTFRFSCLPVSRVECMLKLPSLDIVFSSKRQEEIATDFSDGGKASSSSSSSVSAGGLSVTGCLADFNVYIFHPYGGKKTATGLKETNSNSNNRFAPLSDSERKDSLSVNVEFVKFHITRSRTLNYEPTAKKADQRAMIRFSTIVDIGSASFKYDMRRLTEILAFPKAWYRHSIMRRLFLGDLNIHQTSVGDLEFTPSEEDKTANAYPKAATAAAGNNVTTSAANRAAAAAAAAKLKVVANKSLNSLESSSMSSTSDGSPEVSEPNQVTAWETLVLFAVNFTKLNVQMNMGNVMGNVVWLTKAFQSEGRLSIGSTGYKNMHIGLGLGSSTLDAKGGIVGGTIELSRINTQFRVREESGFEPSHTVGIRLMALELRLDYMGTSVLMTRLSDLNARLRDEWKNSMAAEDVDVTARAAGGGSGPSQQQQQQQRRPTIILIHSDLSWDQCQLMISKSTTADLFKMYFKLEEFFSQQFKSSKRVFTSLELKAAAATNNTTTSSITNTNSMKRKHMRQHSQQQRKRHLSVQSNGGGAGEEVTNNTGGSAAAAASVNGDDEHRHWQRPLRDIQGLFLTTLGVPLSNRETILGGTMELHGRNISLACFHGINFKSKSWALFSLKDPCINFATEAQMVGENAADVNVIQTLTFGLGVGTSTTKPVVKTNAKSRFFGSGTTGSTASSSASSSSAYPQQQQQNNHSMATVCRLSRNIIFPPQFKTLHEWFHYAFANSEIDSVDRFPVLERDPKLATEPNTNSIERSRSTGGSATGTSPKLQDPNHTREVIFALPSLQLHFKTEHFQRSGGGVTDDVGDDEVVPVSDEEAAASKPIVECSFITEFDDHIFVTVDADAFFFLHDLITSYLREKEKVLSNLAASANSHQLPQQRSVSPHSLKQKAAGHEAKADPSTARLTSIRVTTSGDRSEQRTGHNKDRELHISKEDIVQAINAKVVEGSSSNSKEGKQPPDLKSSNNDLESFLKDWRDFKCKTWHLEPTVRLLSWAGKSIEPYGIDFILNKLGFSHARTTIPKWLQRGFMDPLDKLQTLLMLQLLSMVREDQHNNGQTMV